MSASMKAWWTLALAWIVVSAGCTLTPVAGRYPTANAFVQSAPVLDGLIEDWAPDIVCVVDARYVYVRFTVLDEIFTVQESKDRKVTIYLNTDVNDATGLPANAAPVPEARGAEWRVEFSPREKSPFATGPGTGADRGVAITKFDLVGKPTAIGHGEADFLCLPTFASRWYECRIKAGGVARVRGVVTMQDASGRLTASSDLFDSRNVSTPTPPSGSLARVPERGEGLLRVVSYNVHKSKPSTVPEPFSRVLRALNPDVVLIQEWPDADDGALARWFDTYVPGGAGWSVIKGGRGDCAIVSRFPLSPIGLPALVMEREGARPHSVRFVSARAATPMGGIVFGSAHLKCCGGSGSAEDQLRIEEARWINGALHEAMPETSAAMVIGGDLNLVGSRVPLDVLRGGLDLDDTELAVADSRVWDDRAVYTWSDAQSEFPDGRLDYVLYSDAGMKAVRTFVLDTARLSPDSLRALGLEAGDTSASDHLPVVLDLKPEIVPE